MKFYAVLLCILASAPGAWAQNHTDEGVVIGDFLEKKSKPAAPTTASGGLSSKEAASAQTGLNSETAQVIKIDEKKHRGMALNFLLGPFDIERITKTQDITLGTALEDHNPQARVRGGEAELLMKRQRRTNPYDKEQARFLRFQGEGMYYFNQVFGDLDVFSLINFEREEDGDYTPIHHKFLISLAGLKINLGQAKEFREFSVGYAPIWEISEFDRISQGARIGRVRESILRHMLQVQLKTPLWEKMAFKTVFRWRPKHDLKEEKFETSDSDTTWLADMSLMLFKGLSFSYMTELKYDTFRKKIQAVPSTDLRQMINLNYALEL